MNSPFSLLTFEVIFYFNGIPRKWLQIWTVFSMMDFSLWHSYTAIFKDDVMQNQSHKSVLHHPLILMISRRRLVKMSKLTFFVKLGNWDSSQSRVFECKQSNLIAWLSRSKLGKLLLSFKNSLLENNWFSLWIFCFRYVLSCINSFSILQLMHTFGVKVFMFCFNVQHVKTNLQS